METYYGHVRTPGDAILLFEACRIGLLPRVQRRLSEKERLSIRSGSVFVWDEREAGMRRWTDGKSWSASRVSGSFLTYREMEGKRGGSSFAAPAKPPRDASKAEPDASDDGPDGYRYKPDGLIKQSFSITTSTGQHLHLISYFARSAAASQNLQQPSNDPQLRHIRPEKGMYPESTVHDQNTIPAVTRGPMTSPAFGNSPHVPYQRPSPAQYAPMQYGPPGWAPPSPMHTPPPHYSPYYQHSPLQHLHHTYASSHQHHFPPPPMTAFDRAPAPLANSPLPPPPPPPQHPHMLPPHHPHTHSQQQQQQHHSHAPQPQLPQISQQHLPQVSQQQQQQQQHASQVSQRPTLADPHMSRTSSSGHPSIDPALSTNNAYESRNTYESRAPYDSRTPYDARKPQLLSLRPQDTTPGAQNPKDNIPRPSQTLPAVSSATTIPSISSLINETNTAPSHTVGKPPSPNSLTNQRHTQDIPMHKMGHYDAAHDVQALRHLDKATLRF